jgi:hypothetical protein
MLSTFILLLYHYVHLKPQALPAIVRMAVEAEVRRSDWAELSAVQQAAVQAGRLDQAHTWSAYEDYVSKKVRAMKVI